MGNKSACQVAPSDLVLDFTMAGQEAGQHASRNVFESLLTEDEFDVVFGPDSHDEEVFGAEVEDDWAVDDWDILQDDQPYEETEWILGSADQSNNIKFSGAPGRQIPVERDATPITFVNMLLPADFYETLSVQTNR